MVPASVLGGLTGSTLLLLLPSKVFQKVVVVLIGIALMVMFIGDAATTSWGGVFLQNVLHLTFFEARDQRFVPAILAGKRDEASAILGGEMQRAASARAPKARSAASSRSCATARATRRR